MRKRPKIALWFRYGPAEHAELFHAIPEIVCRLAEHAEVHYFGLRSAKPVPEQIARHAVVHSLPFSVNRAVSRDKTLKTILWLMMLPFVALRCRWMGVGAVYVDETVPLSAPLGRIFYGPRLAFTVADFFMRIYAAKFSVMGWVGEWIESLDMAVWRSLPLIFTRARATKRYLTGRGFSAERIRPVYDPCDFSLYHPGGRKTARATYGYTDDNVVLVSHGIMHPNKGNDRIIAWVGGLRERCSVLRLLLVGDGPDMERLKQIARDRNADDIVRFTGWLPLPAQVNMALNAGDIGLVMRAGQESDNFHITGALVHSMACGLPLLAARLEGIAEIVRENETGLLFDPNSKEEFQAQLLRLAGSGALRTKWGAAGLELARELFDLRSVAEATVRPLLELLK